MILAVLITSNAVPTYNLSNNIKQLRHLKGWTQEDVAMQLDISIPAYSKIETGITDVNLSRLEQIALCFETTVVDLLVGESQNSELSALKASISKKDAEITALQKDVIKLYKKLQS